MHVRAHTDSHSVLPSCSTAPSSSTLSPHLNFTQLFPLYTGCEGLQRSQIWSANEVSSTNTVNPTSQHQRKKSRKKFEPSFKRILSSFHSLSSWRVISTASDWQKAACCTFWKAVTKGKAYLRAIYMKKAGNSLPAAFVDLSFPVSHHVPCAHGLHFSRFLQYLCLIQIPDFWLSAHLTPHVYTIQATAVIYETRFFFLSFSNNNTADNELSAGFMNFMAQLVGRRNLFMRVFFSLLIFTVLDCWSQDDLTRDVNSYF